jgi:hypothetical protein
VRQPQGVENTLHVPAPHRAGRYRRRAEPYRRVTFDAAIRVLPETIVTAAGM